MTVRRDNGNEGTTWRWRWHYRAIKRKREKGRLSWQVFKHHSQFRSHHCLQPCLHSTLFSTFFLRDYISLPDHVLHLSPTILFPIIKIVFHRALSQTLIPLVSEINFHNCDIHGSRCVSIAALHSRTFSETFVFDLNLKVPLIAIMLPHASPFPSL